MDFFYMMESRGCYRFSNLTLQLFDTIFDYFITYSYVFALAAAVYQDVVKWFQR